VNQVSTLCRGSFCSLHWSFLQHQFGRKKRSQLQPPRPHPQRTPVLLRPARLHRNPQPTPSMAPLPVPGPARAVHLPAAGAQPERAVQRTEEQRAPEPRAAEAQRVRAARPTEVQRAAQPLGAEAQPALAVQRTEAQRVAHLPAAEARLAQEVRRHALVQPATRQDTPAQPAAQLAEAAQPQAEPHTLARNLMPTARRPSLAVTAALPKSTSPATRPA
jgi:hypothetical protein